MPAWGLNNDCSVSVRQVYEDQEKTNSGISARGMMGEGMVEKLKKVFYEAEKGFILRLLAINQPKTPFKIVCCAFICLSLLFLSCDSCIYGSRRTIINPAPLS